MTKSRRKTEREKGKERARCEREMREEKER